RAQVLLRERFPDRGVHVANFGWISSSPLLTYRRLVDIGEKYRPDLVVQSIDMTDVQDDVRWKNLLARRGICWFYDKLPIALKGFHELAPGLFRRWWSASNDGVPFDTYFIAERPLDETRVYFDALAENLEKIAGWCRERGAAFVVLVMPRSFQYSARECPRDYE